LAAGVWGADGNCCGWEAVPTPFRDRYLKKLIPVPGIVNVTQGAPFGERPIRKPAKPQLTPRPLCVTVVLIPPPIFSDLRQRHPTENALRKFLLGPLQFYARMIG